MMPTLTLEYEPDKLSLLLQQIREAIAGGVRRIVVDLDRLGSIDTNDIRALIILLRRVRERRMALDRIFAMEHA